MKYIYTNKGIFSEAHFKEISKLDPTCHEEGQANGDDEKSFDFAKHVNKKSKPSVVEGRDERCLECNKKLNMDNKCPQCDYEESLGDECKHCGSERHSSAKCQLSRPAFSSRKKHGMWEEELQHSQTAFIDAQAPEISEVNIKNSDDYVIAAVVKDTGEVYRIFSTSELPEDVIGPKWRTWLELIPVPTLADPDSYVEKILKSRLNENVDFENPSIEQLETIAHALSDYQTGVSSTELDPYARKVFTKFAWNIPDIRDFIEQKKAAQTNGLHHVDLSSIDEDADFEDEIFGKETNPNAKTKKKDPEDLDLWEEEKASHTHKWEEKKWHPKYTVFKCSGCGQESVKKNTYRPDTDDEYDAIRDYKAMYGSRIKENKVEKNINLFEVDLSSLDSEASESNKPYDRHEDGYITSLSFGQLPSDEILEKALADGFSMDLKGGIDQVIFDEAMENAGIDPSRAPNMMNFVDGFKQVIEALMNFTSDDLASDVAQGLAGDIMDVIGVEWI